MPYASEHTFKVRSLHHYVTVGVQFRSAKRRQKFIDLLNADPPKTPA